MDVNTASVTGVFQQAAAMTSKSLFAESLNDVHGMPDGEAIGERINNCVQFARANIGSGIVAAFEMAQAGEEHEDINCMFAPS